LRELLFKEAFETTLRGLKNWSKIPPANLKEEKEDA